MQVFEKEAKVAQFFKERLRQSRIAKGVSQKNVASEVGLSTNSYQAYELGEKFPSFMTLPFLADYFDVSIDYLLGRTDVPQVVRSAQWQANQEP